MLFVKKGLFKLNICLNYICSLFAAGQVTVRTSYVRGWLARSVSLDHSQQTSKKVQPAPQIAQIDPRISRAIFEHKIAGTPFFFKKGRVGFLELGFWNAGKQVLSALPGLL